MHDRSIQTGQQQKHTKKTNKNTTLPGVRCIEYLYNEQTDKKKTIANTKQQANTKTTST